MFKWLNENKVNIYINLFLIGILMLDKVNKGISNVLWKFNKILRKSTLLDEKWQSTLHFENGEYMTFSIKTIGKNNQRME